MKTIIYSEKAPNPIGPYSQAVKVGQTLYISGQIPIDQQKGKLIDETIEAETAQVMKNIGYILEEVGASYENVVKCSIFIRNMSDFSKINVIYGEYFSSNPPARETVEVSGLPKGVNIEISCIVAL